MADRPNRAAGIVVGIVVAIAVLVVAARTGLQWFTESDYRSSRIDLGFEDGARVIVEPGDEFEIGLHAHPTEPALAWVVAATDPAVVETLTQEHEQRAAELPDDYMKFFMSEAMQALWTDPPDPSRPPDVQSEDEGPFWLWPHSYFVFAGKGVGMTNVVLELRAGGELLDTHEVEVWVVDDACQYFEGQDSLTKVPHRCG